VFDFLLYGIFDINLLEELALRATRRWYGRCDYCNRNLDDGAPCKFPRRHALAIRHDDWLAT